jgi:TetR/AcrR family transcriptional regulator, regulator of cefoperazone and chloramphenicol sensitivity
VNHDGYDGARGTRRGAPRGTKTGAAKDTRQRLIDAATRMFAERGYRHVTIRAISQAARANVAAVNYHFSDKLGLYREVLEAAGQVILETTAEAVREGDGLPPREQLRIYIRVMCERMHSTPGPSSIQQLIQQEVDEPTEELDGFVARTLRPRFDYLYRVVGELLGRAPDDERVRLCAISIHGLIVMFRPNPMTERFGALLGLKFRPETVAEHLMAFSLAALDDYAAPPSSRPAARAARR